VVRRSLAVVSDELETANHLSDGEESKTLGEYDTAGNDLSGAEVSCLLQEVLWRLEDAAALDRSPKVLVVRLESSNGGRAHLLALEDQLAELEADLGVVDDKGSLLLNKGDNLASAAANLGQGATQALRSTSQSRTSSAGDARQALLSPRLVLLRLSGRILGSLGGLLGGCALESAAGEAQDR